MSSRTTSLILTPVRRISRLNPLPFSSTTIPGCPSPRCVFISSRRPVHGNVVRRLDTTDSHGDGSFPSITLLTTASNSVSPYGLETSARAPFFASCDRICGSKNPLATTTFTEGFNDWSEVRSTPPSAPGRPKSVTTIAISPICSLYASIPSNPSAARNTRYPLSWKVDSSKSRRVGSSSTMSTPSPLPRAEISPSGGRASPEGRDSLTGKKSLKTVPSPSVESTSTNPPWVLTTP